MKEMTSVSEQETVQETSSASTATERFLEKKYGLYDRINVSKRGLDVFILMMILVTLLLIFYGVYSA